VRAADVIARPDSGRTYMAARFELTLVRRPVVKKWNPVTGEMLEQTQPDRIRFRRGMFKAKTKEDVEFLENHPRFGDPVDGFWRVEMPPPPPSQEELSAILGASNDLRQLEEVLEAERRGYARKELLEIVEGQIARLKEAQEAQEPQEAQEAPKRPQPQPKKPATAAAAKG